MNRQVVASLLVLAVATPLCGADPLSPRKLPALPYDTVSDRDIDAAFPQQLAPSIGVAVIGEGGDLGLTQRVSRLVPEQVVERVEEIADGKAVTKERTYTVTRPIWETRPERYEPGDYHVYKNGVRVDRQAVMDLLKKATPVVISGSFGPLDPFYQQLLKPETIVVCVRPNRSSTPNQPPRLPAPPSAARSDPSGPAHSVGETTKKPARPGEIGPPKSGPIPAERPGP
jgi:hypothetical protein